MLEIRKENVLRNLGVLALTIGIVLIAGFLSIKFNQLVNGGDCIQVQVLTMSREEILANSELIEWLKFVSWLPMFMQVPVLKIGVFFLIIGVSFVCIPLVLLIVGGTLSVLGSMRIVYVD